MRSCWWRAIILAAVAASSAAPGTGGTHAANDAPQPPAAYVGFDSNNYPGDAALPVLRKTFSFTGYWLNQPPGGASVPWSGKRARLIRAGFGFLVLFNGRLERELRNSQRAVHVGSSDAALAVNAAIREGFHFGTIIFLDQEEGGEMEPDQLAYVLAWIDGVNAAHFRAGIYCSGIPASAGADGMVITANDIRRRAGKRNVSFFVYNDACPPSPGCAISNRPPAPSQSGVPVASVWQFAQSPRRHQYTAACSSSYNPDGNCYPPSVTQQSALLIWIPPPRPIPPAAAGNRLVGSRAKRARNAQETAWPRCASAAENATSASSLSRAAPESIDSTAIFTPARKSVARPAATSAAAAFASTISRCGP